MSAWPMLLQVLPSSGSRLYVALHNIGRAHKFQAKFVRCNIIARRDADFCGLSAHCAQEEIFLIGVIADHEMGVRNPAKAIALIESVAAEIFRPN